MNLFSKASQSSKTMGLVFCSIHFLISWSVIISVAMGSRDAQWQLVWVFFWLFDFPVSVIHVGVLRFLPQFDIAALPISVNSFNDFLAPTLIFGLLGPLWYGVVPIAISHTVNAFRSRRLSVTSK